MRRYYLLFITRTLPMQLLVELVPSVVMRMTVEVAGHVMVPKT